jgi:NhaP-type Na+/H+ and K+/H+ antiporter
MCVCSRRLPACCRCVFAPQVCRAILLLLCWIPFNYTGYPMTWRTFLVFLWGGLRGAVGMVMALFVFLDEEIHNSKFRSYAIFYMGTMVSLSEQLLAGVDPTVARLGRIPCSLALLCWIPLHLSPLF